MPTESHKSLTGKLRQAIEAIDSGRIALADEIRAANELDRLDLANIEELKDLLYDCLQLALEDPIHHYRQPDHAISTKHKVTRDLRMWAFEVPHEAYRTPIYFKFCLKQKPDGSFYCHICCHEHQLPRT